MSFQRTPDAIFGRRRTQLQPPSATVQVDLRASSKHLSTTAVIEIAVLILLIATLAWRAPAKGSIEARLAEAKARVVEIVNQPVTRLPRTQAAAKFSPGWFHEGAETPDFGHPDVRTTQVFPYARSTFVTSDLNPSEMFLGAELEFNSMTKLFYTDRSVPKRRLSEEDMLNINQLYRAIGEGQQALCVWWLTMGGLAALALAVAGMFTLQVLRLRQPDPSL